MSMRKYAVIILLALSLTYNFADAHPGRTAQ